MTITKQDLIDLGCEPEDVNDWFAYRKLKRKPEPTQRGIKAMLTECEKAGITLPEAVKMCADNEWIGFKASYMPKHQFGLVTAPTQPQNNKQAVRASLRDITNTDW